MRLVDRWRMIKRHFSVFRWFDLIQQFQLKCANGKDCDLEIGNYSRNENLLTVRKANACVECCVLVPDEIQFNADRVKAVINMS